MAKLTGEEYVELLKRRRKEFLDAQPPRTEFQLKFPWRAR